MGILTLSRKIRDKKVLFLDLDNTLYAYDPCHRLALKKTHEVYRKKIEKISFRTFLRSYGTARDSVHRRLRGQGASHSRLLYFQALCESRLGKTDFENTLRLEAVYWNAFLRKMRLAAWVRPFLAYCRRNGKRIVVVTNLTAQIQLRKIQRLRLAPWIDFLVSSEEAGIEKPGSRIFRLAIQKAGCRAGDVLVVGDHSRCDRSSFLEFFRQGPKS